MCRLLKSINTGENKKIEKLYNNYIYIYTRRKNIEYAI